MKLVKTIKCKLEISKEQSVILIETINRFTSACNDILKISKDHNIKNKVKLQRLCYHELKEHYSLQSNLVIRAIARVSTQLSKHKSKQPESFKAGSFDLDARTFSFKECDMTISIATYAGRLKNIKLIIGNYQSKLLKGQKPTSAIFVYNKHKKCFYIHIVLEKSVETPFNPNGNIIGIDRGIYNLVSCSNGIKYSGKKVKHIREHYSKLRASLQSKGTKGAKRLLKRLSGKESRWMKDINHVISKKIVSSINTGDTVVMEDLTYIRERVKILKKQRLILHSWAFGQIQKFIEYKALEKGIKTVYIDPRYTSQKCPKCGYIHKSNRVKHLFSCKNCNFTGNADYIASLNIRQVYIDTLTDGVMSTTPETVRLIRPTSFGTASPCLQAWGL